MATLTVFTPTYNRAHTLPRTYESLCRQSNKDFEWLVIDDGSTDGTSALVESWQSEQNADENGLKIRYIYKENGGLYTGYNTAYANIETELCVCIDSDDYMPDDAVEKILNCWNGNSDIHDKVCGIEGLDFDIRTKNAIGGEIPLESIQNVFPPVSAKTAIAYHYTLPHRGDTKYVMRTDLMKTVAPMDGFPGEKDFNPHYMLMQIFDEYPLIVVNENYCWVDYQIGADSMSEAILKQYVRSSRSFAKYRLMEMRRKHGMSLKRLLKVHVHYVSSCILSKDIGCLKKSHSSLLSLAMFPFGLCLAAYLLIKTRKQINRY